MDPVPDLKPVSCDTAMKPAAPYNRPAQEHAEQHVATSEPFLLPLRKHRLSRAEVEGLLGRPGHPRAQVLETFKHGAMEQQSVRCSPATKQQAMRSLEMLGQLPFVHDVKLPAARG
jgi:hypothetical protein